MKRSRYRHDVLQNASRVSFLVILKVGSYAIANAFVNRLSSSSLNMCPDFPGLQLCNIRYRDGLISSSRADFPIDAGVVISRLFDLILSSRVLMSPRGCLFERDSRQGGYVLALAVNFVSILISDARLAWTWPVTLS